MYKADSVRSMNCHVRSHMAETTITIIRVGSLDKGALLQVETSTREYRIHFRSYQVLMGWLARKWSWRGMTVRMFLFVEDIEYVGSL